MVYTFQSSEGNQITLRASSYESAMYDLCREVEHPADWILIEQDGHVLDMTELILNTVDPVDID